MSSLINRAVKGRCLRHLKQPIALTVRAAANNPESSVLVNPYPCGLNNRFLITKVFWEYLSLGEEDHSHLGGEMQFAPKSPNNPIFEGKPRRVR